MEQVYFAPQVPLFTFVCACMCVLCIYVCLCVGVCMNLNSLATVSESLVMCWHRIKARNKALSLCITLLRESRFAFSILLSQCLQSFLSACYNFELVPA